MRDVNDRVMYLERRMEDHTALMADLRSEMRDLRSEMTNLRSTVEGGFSRLDQKIDRHFMWLVGIMVTAFAAFIGMTYR